MVSDAQIDRSREIQRRTGRTFYLATRFLPRQKREPTHVLYAFFRVADEIVDGDELSPAEQRNQLEEIRRQLFGQTEGRPEVAAFDDMRRRHDLKDEDVRSFLDSMEMDVSRQRYETYEQLEKYMDGSAAAVGRMMTAVMRPEDHEKAVEHASALGEAFQMTNFLRDVREDAEELGRVYIPSETLETHGADVEDVLELEDSPAVRRSVADEIERAEELYREGVKGLNLLPEGCRFPVLLAAVLYSDYHRQIQKLEHAVVRERPELSSARKAYLCIRTWFEWRRTGRDAEDAFYRASCVSRAPRPVNHDEPNKEHEVRSCPVSLLFWLTNSDLRRKVASLLRR
ncbi:MAG: phytoene/squalene synthase family protein [Halobacteriales archaeon]